MELLPFCSSCRYWFKRGCVWFWRILSSDLYRKRSMVVNILRWTKGSPFCRPPPPRYVRNHDYVMTSTDTRIEKRSWHNTQWTHVPDLFGNRIYVLCHSPCSIHTPNVYGRIMRRLLHQSRPDFQPLSVNKYWVCINFTRDQHGWVPNYTHLPFWLHGTVDCVRVSSPHPPPP